MAAAYDSYDYPSYWENRNYEHKSEVVAIKAFLSHIPKFERIVDLGCGFGRLTPYYIYRAKSITLVDPSRKLLREAKKRIEAHKKAWEVKHKRIAFKQSRVETINKKYKKGKFDVVIMVRVMHHITDPAKTIKIISDIVTPGGYIILELANKIHGKATFTNILKGNLTFPLDIFPADRLTAKNKRKKTIPFFNYHPDVIKDALTESGFKILQIRSVSNIRNSWIKRNIPLPVLIGIEKKLQQVLAKVYFGPSIFILARKKG